MIVVADTTPVNYLILIDLIDLLPALFEKAVLPQAVIQELQHPKTSDKVRNWVANLPGWIDVCSVTSVALQELMSLDPGEREAIQLALEMGIGTVLMDEAAGRRQAEKLNLEERGTLGILERASRLGLIDFRHALNDLQQTKFRASAAVYAAFLARNT